jgi:tetratricopeptide (TPR) repeat protein
MISRMEPARVIGDGASRTRYQEMSAPLRKTNSIYLDYYDKAVREYQQGNLSAAESLLAKALAADSRQPAFHSMNGFIGLKKKDYAGAQKSFDAALAIDREYEPAYRGLGTLRYLREDYAGGIDPLKQSLSLYPQDLNSHYFLGMSYYKMKRYSEATPHLKMVAEAAPKHPQVNGVLGICYENSGDTTSAYHAYVAQVKAAPDSEIGRHAASRAKALKPAVDKKR